MQEIRYTEIQRKEYMIVEYVANRTVAASVDTKTYPLGMAILLARIQNQSAGLADVGSTFTVEDADTGEMVWPEEVEEA